MDFLTWVILIAIGVYVLQGVEQRRRVRLLAQHLAPTKVEKILGTLIDGYMRALEEKDTQRQQQVWAILNQQEQSLVTEFQRFADSFAKAPIEETRVSTLPLALPYFDRVLPQYTFDMREALQLHAQGIRDACALPDLVGGDLRKEMAFTMTAELLLMQHSCHWFGRTRTVASMRLLARHKTQYEQVLQSVSANTRRAYKKMVGMA